MADPHLIERLRDLAAQARDQGYVTHSPFLSPAERAEAEIWLKKNRVPHLFSGGIAGAERQAVFFLPDYMAYMADTSAEAADAEESGIADIVSDSIRALRLDTPARSEAPGHRDYLGSLLGLGIKRGQMGDIIVQDHAAFVIVLSGISGFLENHLERIGGQSVKITEVPLSSVSAPERDFESVRITVASLRLDKIAAGGFGLPRTETADLIRSGAVQVNWKEETRPDQSVPIGAVISLRGHGRIRLASEEGLSRKDRHILILERHL